MKNTLELEGYELLSQKIYRILKVEIVKGFLEPRNKLLENKIALSGSCKRRFLG